MPTASAVAHGKRKVTDEPSVATAPAKTAKLNAAFDPLAGLGDQGDDESNRMLLSLSKALWSCSDWNRYRNKNNPLASVLDLKGYKLVEDGGDEVEDLYAAQNAEDVDDHGLANSDLARAGWPGRALKDELEHHALQPLYRQVLDV